VWHASRHGGSRAVASSRLACRCTRDGCLSLSSIARTAMGSPGRRSFDSPRISASRVRRCNSPSVGCSRSARSSSTSLAVPVARPGTECVRSRRLYLPDSRAGWSRSTCPIHGAGCRSRTCPPDGHEVLTSHVGRSAVAVRALPGARRSLRSLRVNPINQAIHMVGRGACVASPRRSPSGGREGEPWTRPRTPQCHLPACSLLRRLPATLADDEQQEHGHVGRSANVLDDGRSMRGCPAQPRYAREEAQR